MTELLKDAKAHNGVANQFAASINTRRTYHKVMRIPDSALRELQLSEQAITNTDITYESSKESQSATTNH